MLVTLYHKIMCLSIHIFVFSFFTKNLRLFSVLTVSPNFPFVNHIHRIFCHTGGFCLSPLPFLFCKRSVHTLIIAPPTIGVKDKYSCHLHPRCWAVADCFLHFQRSQRTIISSFCQVTTKILAITLSSKSTVNDFRITHLYYCIEKPLIIFITIDIVYFSKT